MKLKYNIKYICNKLLIAILVACVSVICVEAQALDEVIAPSNYVYSQQEVGEYKNNCIYDEQPFFIPDANRHLIDISDNKPTTSDKVLGCFPISYNSNGQFYNMIKMDLKPGIESCPQIELQEILPVGTPTETYKFMNISKHAFYHRSAASYFVPRLSIAVSKGNSCYYNIEANFYQNQDNKKEYMTYFLIDTKQLEPFVKGDRFAERYSGRFVPGASWEGATIDEATHTYYKLPKMELTSFRTSDKYNIITDLNMNRGKYVSSTTLAQSGKQELDNVVFFPGLLGSQLQNVYTNQTVWPSSNYDIQSSMKIVNPTFIHSFSLSHPFDPTMYVYNDTKSKYDGGVTRTAGAYGINIDIYDSWLNSLQQLKDSSQMNDYAAIPYDFRMFTDDIYCNGKVSGVDKVSYDTQSYGAFYTWPWDCRDTYVYSEIKRMALSSKTGKVTLVGHSYGGLVIKEVLKHLEDTHDSLLAHIDKVILVAVPQAGAPEDILGMLHGEKLGYGAIMSATTSKELLQTFPMAYQLLPSDSLIRSSTKPMVYFTPRASDGVPMDTGSDYSTYVKALGNSIDTFAELSEFILNKMDGTRSTTTYDVNLPCTGYKNLLDYAVQRKAILDNYVPTSTIEVHQIAGTGIPTITGYKYDRTKYCSEYNKIKEPNGRMVDDITSCKTWRYRPTTSNNTDTNGDYTVPVSSALHMPTSSPNVNNWLVDLAGYNKGFKISRDHKDILSATSVRDKLLNIIKNKSTTPVPFISSSGVSNTTKYTKLTTHSPVTISITDSKGNVAGYSSSTRSEISNIPGVYEFVIGDTHTMVIPDNSDYVMNLSGLATSTYALDIEKINEDGLIISSTTYYSMPVTPYSQSYIIFNNQATTSPLVIDYNGNGIVDAVVNNNATNTTYSASSTVPETVNMNDYIKQYIAGTSSEPYVYKPKSNATTTATSTATSTPTYNDGPTFITQPKLINDIPPKVYIEEPPFIKVIKKRK